MSDYERIALALMTVAIIVGIAGVAVLIVIAKQYTSSEVVPEPEPEPDDGPLPLYGHRYPLDRTETGTDGVLRITGPGAVYERTLFRCLVEVEAEGAVFKDCRFAGPETVPANSALLRTATGRGSASVHNSTFSPEHPQPGLDGVRGSNILIAGCEITGTVDGVHVYGDLKNPDDPRAGMVTVQDTWIHDLVVFPSTSHSDGYTHNDGVQMVSGDDCLFTRVKFSGTMRNAAFMINPTKGSIDGLTIRDCSIDTDSASGINISNAAPLSGLWITGNVFPRAWDGKKYPMLVSKVTLDQGDPRIEANHWDDGGLPGPAVKRGA